MVEYAILSEARAAAVPISDAVIDVAEKIGIINARKSMLRTRMIARRRMCQRVQAAGVLSIH
jgi:hypothetical protein